MKKMLTVFTPTYNRAYCLHKCYESLCRQTCCDFQWLIIDDGSVDNTKELVEAWQRKKNSFQIDYVYKVNGGLHTGYNKALEIMDTELCVCIDSDDFMPDNAVELIVDFWNKNKEETYAGIIGLDYLLEGKATGGKLPDVYSLYLTELCTKYHYHGDTKIVYRTQLLKEVAPQPTFKKEKNFNPIYMMYLVDKNYPLLVLNENLCFVDYQEDGMTKNTYRQYVDSPLSFAALRKLFMTMPGVPYSYVFRQNIHYVSSCLFGQDWSFIQKSPKKLTTVLAIPFGVLLWIFLKWKTCLSK